MLDLAYNHKDTLRKIYARMLLNPEKYKYVIGDSWVDYEIAIDNNNYNKLQFVSITPNTSNIQGYLSCKINRRVHYAYSIVVIHFYTKPTFSFSKDLKTFLIDMLLCQYKFNKLQFACIVGNPIEKTYDRIVLQNGGRIVGIYKRDARLLDNKVYDLKLYEITRKNIFLNKNICK